MPNHIQKGVPIYQFGWWPEIVGAIYALILIWFLFSFADGFI